MKDLPISFKTRCEGCNSLRRNLFNGAFLSAAQAHFKKCDRCHQRNLQQRGK